MLNLSLEYPGKVAAPDASYPQGGAKNETAPGNFDGTPFEEAILNDIVGPQQALIKMAGIVPSGNADSALDKNSSQQLQAILHAVTSAFTFVESGAADVYVLSAVGDNPAPANYSSNMNVVFTPTNTNTGASTIDVEGLGAKSIRVAGVALIGGELVAGVRYTIIYDSVNGWFELVLETGKVVQTKNITTGAVATGTTQMIDDDSIPQNTEGDEYLSLAITPRSTINILRIDIVLNIVHSTSGQRGVAALFQDAVADALSAVRISFDDLPNDGDPLVFSHYMLAGTVAATTFKVRAGAATAGTSTVNGDGGVRRLGGVFATSMTITEETP